MDDRALRVALGYRRFRSRAPRILLMSSGHHVEADVIDAADDLGWPTAIVPTPSKGTADSKFVATLLEAICVHRPDFVLAINHRGFGVDGALASLLDRYDVAVASWFVDHPLLVLEQPARQATKNTQAFCVERTALGSLARAGFESPLYLPTAASARRFHPARIDRPLAEALGARLAFAGHSGWREAREGLTDDLRARIQSLGLEPPPTRAFVAADLDAFLSAGGDEARPERLVALRAAVAESSLAERCALVGSLQPLEIVVHGDPAWRRLVPSIELRPELEPARGLPALFAGSTVNVNVTAVDLPTAVRQCVWEVPACGGFLLTDEREDALEVFGEDRAVATYSTLEECADMARFYLANATARTQLVQRARRIVEASHRSTHRLTHIATVMARRERMRAPAGLLGLEDPSPA